MFLKGLLEKMETHTKYSKPFLEILTFHKITWKNIADRGRPHMTIRCMQVECWILKAKNTVTIRYDYCLTKATTVVRKCL
jgi:hypothetical protein